MENRSESLSLATGLATMEQLHAKPYTPVPTDRPSHGCTSRGAELLVGIYVFMAIDQSIAIEIGVEVSRLRLIPACLSDLHVMANMQSAICFVITRNALVPVIQDYGWILSISSSDTHIPPTRLTERGYSMQE